MKHSQNLLLQIRITMMRIRVPLFYFDADPDPTPHQNDATTGLQTLRASILSLHVTKVSLLGSIVSLHIS